MRTRLLASLLLAAVVLALQGCTTDAPKAAEAAVAVTPAEPAGALALTEAPAPPIGISVYHCDNGTDLSVDNLGASVRVTEAAGEAIDMPASPADSRNRYVQANYAIVLEGSDALFMRPRGGPIACKR